MSDDDVALQMVQENAPPGLLDMYFNDSNMHSLLFAIAGPEDTSFSGGVYVLKVRSEGLCYVLPGADYTKVSPTTQHLTMYIRGRSGIHLDLLRAECIVQLVSGS